MRSYVWCGVVSRLLGVAIVSLMVSGVAAVTTAAAPVTLAWDAAGDPAVRGYAVYYGKIDEPATNRADAGDALSFTFNNLQANTTYRFMAVAYTDQGLESLPSNELLVTTRPQTRFAIARLGNGRLRMSGRAAPGTACTLLFTPTLHPPNWMPLKHVTADAAGDVIAEDALDQQSQSRFYQIVPGVLPLASAIDSQRLSDGSVQLTGTAPPFVTGRIVFTSSPATAIWQTLATFTANAEGQVEHVDTTARQAQIRFYNMVIP